MVIMREIPQKGQGVVAGRGRPLGRHRAALATEPRGFYAVITKRWQEMASQYRIERDRGTKESQRQLAGLRERWPLAFPATALNVSCRSFGLGRPGWTMPFFHPGPSHIRITTAHHWARWSLAFPTHHARCYSNLMRSRLLASFLILALANVTVTSARAYNEDLHYYVTFVLAVTLGMEWDQALAVASATQAVDQNLFTKPTEHAAWKSPTGHNDPEQQTLGPLPLSLGLSLQDYFFHCFSRERGDTRGQPHATVIEHLNGLEKRAVTLIDEGNTSNDANDKSRALIAIGIYLHCQQDSLSHSGYGGDPMGHVWAEVFSRSPDDTQRYPDNTKKALVQTVEKLRAFVAQLGRNITDVSDAELAVLFRGLSEGPDVPDRPLCNKKIIEYWFRKMADLHPIDVSASRLHEQSYTYTVGQWYRETVDRSSGDIKRDIYATSLQCLPLLKAIFPEINDAYYKPIRQTLYNITMGSDLADLSLLAVPPGKFPSFAVTIFAEPTFRKQPGVYD
jgi:hypothetical protein